MARFFFLSVLWIYYLFLSWSTRFLHINPLIVVCEFLCVWQVTYLLLISWISLCLCLCQFNYNVPWCTPLWIQAIWWLLSFMNSISLHKFGNLSAIFLKNRIFVSFSFSSSSGIPIMQILFHVMVFHTAVAFLLFKILFSFCPSDWLILNDFPLDGGGSQSSLLKFNSFHLCVFFGDLIYCYNFKSNLQSGW